MKNIFNISILLCIFVVTNFLAPTAKVSGLGGPLASVPIRNGASSNEGYARLQAALPGYRFSQDERIVTEETLDIREGAFPVYAIRRFTTDEIISRLQGFRLQYINYMRDLPHFQGMEDFLIMICGSPLYGNQEVTEANLHLLLNREAIQIVPVRATRFRLPSPILNIFVSNISEENRPESLINIMDLCKSMQILHKAPLFFSNTPANIGLFDMAFRYWLHSNANVRMDRNALIMGQLRVECSVNSDFYETIQCNIKISHQENRLMEILVPALGVLDFLNFIKNGRHFIV